MRIIKAGFPYIPAAGSWLILKDPAARANLRQAGLWRVTFSISFVFARVTNLFVAGKTCLLQTRAFEVSY